MAFKLKTSKKTADIIDRLEVATNMPCFTLVKLAMALSLNSGEALAAEDFQTNALGRELNRQTITGDADAVYKCLMELFAGKHLSDDEFFPGHVKAHIDRGVILLERESRYSGDLLTHLSNLDKGI